MGMSGQCHALAASSAGNGPVPIVQEAEWALSPVYRGMENLAPTRISACSKSLYRPH